MPAAERVRVRPDLELRIIRWGPTAPPARFLLVHGLASNARLWDGVGRALVAAGSSAVAVDLRGHGQSDKPDAGYDFESVDADLAGLIEALGLEAPVLVGQSWGASVVLDLAVRRPDLASGVVLVDGGVTDLQDGFPEWDACWERLAPPRLVGLPLAQIEGYFRSAHADWPETGLDGSLANFDRRPDGTIAPWLTRERHKLILRALWEERHGPLWSALAVPAIVVTAVGDGSPWEQAKTGGVAKAEATLAARGVPVRTVAMRGDHDLHAQHPDAIAALLLEAERDGFFARATAVEPSLRLEPAE